MIRIVDLIKSILNLDHDEDIEEERKISMWLLLDSIFSLWFLHFSTHKITQNAIQIYLVLLIFFLCFFFCICSPTGHINIIFEYHVFNTRKSEVRKGNESITSTRAHHWKDTNSEISYFVHNMQKRNNANNHKKNTIRNRWNGKEKKTVYHTKWLCWPSMFCAALFSDTKCKT